MEDEEAEWQKVQTQIGGQPEDEDQDKYEAMEEDQDQGKGKAMGEGEGEGEDEGEATDEDDILPGCYILGISIDGITPSSLWIRADYIHVYNFFQAHYDKHANLRNPGVEHRVPCSLGYQVSVRPQVSLHQRRTQARSQGKSFWTYYAARRHLAEMKPFIWFYKAKYYLFVDDDVYKLPPDWEHDDFRCIVWTLVDSDQSRAGVPEILIPHGTRLFVTYVTSPVADRWSRMNKTTQRVIVIVNL